MVSFDRSLLNGEPFEELKRLLVFNWETNLDVGEEKSCIDNKKVEAGTVFIWEGQTCY